MIPVQPVGHLRLRSLILNNDRWEVEGEEKKEARMEGGWGEEPSEVSLPREAKTPKQRTS